MKSYQVNCDNVFLRRGPGKKNGVLKMMKNGDMVTSEEEKEENGWMRVDYQGTIGYAQTRYLTETDNAQYDDDSIGAALETAIANVQTAFDELIRLVRML